MQYWGNDLSLPPFVKENTFSNSIYAVYIRNILYAILSPIASMLFILNISYAISNSVQQYTKQFHISMIHQSEKSLLLWSDWQLNVQHHLDWKSINYIMKIWYSWTSYSLESFLFLTLLYATKDSKTTSAIRAAFR